ncbi:hypothetical protein J2786_002689 [Chryseobacterium vietnamense]|uniref:Uncharacterized protein n=1 Tax=Chryseobacterium vietnamense TaxID=866785 RepID=A0ACC6J9V4_9FLAO|nr:hypothetical protein [Chryseobacterium vietnamense]MDR6459582.1 hypothetical protein [Chryseobacterium vietnamense]
MREKIKTTTKGIKALHTPLLHQFLLHSVAVSENQQLFSGFHTLCG